ncbi:flagellar attachment zone protein 1-like [Leptopilina boulardi]|uniref:flagellar attachment zone protein 1-like n=1 Tax=Leptopilina boulardi TaxID=63433 RepID=UPI0021F58122|nr:flagellar attachment zone protein 1-like [Leptopilina boulardi]
MKILQLEYESLMEKNMDLQKELRKYRIDFELIEQELKKQNEICLLRENLQTELDNVQKLKTELEKNNENLVIELEKYKVEYEMIQEELKQQNTEYIPKLRSDLENMDFQKQALITELEEMRNHNERLIEKLKLNDDKEDRLNERISELENNQKEMIEKLKAKILFSEQQTENYISELNDSEKMSNFLKRLLEEKSDCMAKLQAAYQVMKNNNTILKTEYEKLEIKAKEDICALQSKKKEIQLQLEIIENNYETVTQDFNKSQELLNISVKREVELQQMLTNMEKKFYSRMMNTEEEEVRLKELTKKLKKELEHEKEEVSSKKIELEKIQSACNLFSSQLEETQYELQSQKKNNLKLQSVNSSIKAKLQDYREENSKLLRKIKFLEQNNDKSNNDLEDMHNMLVDLKKECKMKNRSLASITAELSQATASRSELCNESQYVVSCIRDWMEEQNNIVDTLNEKLKSKQEQLEILGFQKKALLMKIKEQKRIINAFQQKRKRYQRSYMGSRNICNNKNYFNLRTLQTQSEPSSTHSLLSKEYFARRCKKSEYWSSTFFQEIKHLTKALKKGNEFFQENSTFHSENDFGIDENRDCGYQSSTSK